jgi:hypothetical protein
MAGEEISEQTAEGLAEGLLIILPEDYFLVVVAVPEIRTAVRAATVEEVQDLFIS